MERGVGFLPGDLRWWKVVWTVARGGWVRILILVFFSIQNPMIIISCKGGQQTITPPAPANLGIITSSSRLQEELTPPSAPKAPKILI